MSSIANKIRDRRPKEQPEPPAEIFYSPKPLPDNLPAPAVCPRCSCPGFWVDPYGRVNCFDCTPPKSHAQVRRQLFVKLGEDDRPIWVDLLADGKPTKRIAKEQKKYQPPEKQPSIEEIFIIRQLTPPPGVDPEDWWNGELTERSKLIDEINGGKLKRLAAELKKTA